MSNLAEKRSIPRLRTIKAALDEIRAEDPNTAITEWYIRSLCKSNRVDFLKSGRKVYVHMQSLWQYIGFSEE